MKYRIKFELKSEAEGDSRRAYDDNNSSQTIINVSKTIEAETEKQALQKVINLISDKEK